ncbi:MAG: hypothetical protein SV186_03755 [Candidatus Nanohaloarchaea archaeon]|nr:hypothetical protein [Candidatus Nanohaloarchaea archaeon]
MKQLDMTRRQRLVASACVFLLVLAVSYGIYTASENRRMYHGLPTVPCLNPAREVQQDYTLRISVSIDGERYPIPSDVGHAPGNCLREVYTNSSGGVVHVTSVSNTTYTLGQFFDVWHRHFTRDQLFGHVVSAGHTLTVSVDGERVDTYRETPLRPGSRIHVEYE